MSMSELLMLIGVDASSDTDNDKSSLSIIRLDAMVELLFGGKASCLISEKVID